MDIVTNSSESAKLSEISYTADYFDDCTDVPAEAVAISN